MNNNFLHTVYLKELIHPEARNYLLEHANVVSSLDDKSIEGIITRGEDINREVIKSLPNLKVIGKHGVGYDTIDTAAAAEYGITVLYTPGCNTEAVAELIVAHILNVYRKFNIAVEETRGGKIREIAPEHLIGREIYGKTVALVGVGRIGQLVGKMLKAAFNVELLGYDPLIDEKIFSSLGIRKFNDIKELCSLADIVNISIPLSPLTENLFDEDVLASLKSDAVLINTSRGKIVNETALYSALADKKIYGAAMDVSAVEPMPSDAPLLKLPNFILTPHIGACTDEAMLKMGMTAVKDVLGVLDGKEPMWPIK